MSIGELTNLYRDGELDVHPEFQRVFRWDVTQKSKLIESLLLGIPLPSIFVAQTDDGTWDVVDGVQRISTILEIQGLLKDDEGNTLPMLRLVKTPLLPQLEGLSWEDDDPSNSLTQAQRLDIRRAKIDLKIIKRDSSPDTKYDLFQRLNSYGTVLTRQEVRSCTIINSNREFYSWVNALRYHPSFVETTALNERLIAEQYDLELVLRFIALRTLPEQDISKLGYIGDFLDAEAIRLASMPGYPREKEGDLFRVTFDALAASGTDEVLRKYEPSAGRFKGAFQNASFEIFALGLGFHAEYYASRPHEVRALERAKQLWESGVFPKGFSTGKRADERMTQTISRGRQIFAP